ncbi:hypothetical protein [Eoetvoesiella caeni]
MLEIIEWIGCITGLAGAFLLATNSRFSPYGWIAFLIANIAMIILAASLDRFGLLGQQIGFMGTSLLGIYRTKLWLPQLNNKKQSKSI